MKNKLSIAGFILLCLIWSSTWLFIKLGLETMPPFLSAGIRFFIAFVALSIYALALKLAFPRGIKEHLFLFFFGQIIFTISYGLVYWGEQYIGSGLTSVLFSVMPFYTALIAPKMLPGEHMTGRKTIGLVLGFAGILLIFGDQMDLDFDRSYKTWGMIAILLSPLFSSYGTILGKKYIKRFHPVTLNTLPLFYASISFLLVAFWTENTETAAFTNMAVFSLLYLALFGTAIAFVVYFWLLKNMSTILMSSITFITPPLALFWGWLFLNEPISAKLIVGMIIIFWGVWIARDIDEAKKG